VLTCAASYYSPALGPAGARYVTLTDHGGIEERKVYLCLCRHSQAIQRFLRRVYCARGARLPTLTGGVTQALGYWGDSGTGVLGSLRYWGTGITQVLGYWDHSGTGVLGSLRYWGTGVLGSLRYWGTGVTQVQQPGQAEPQ
jgi:hypothetical protein